MWRTTKRGGMRENGTEREREKEDTCERGQCECVHTPAKLLNSRKSARVQNLKEPRDFYSSSPFASLVSPVSLLAAQPVCRVCCVCQFVKFVWQSGN